MLKERLSEDLKNGVERLMRPLFMPRNEEEVMRNDHHIGPAVALSARFAPGYHFF